MMLRPRAAVLLLLCPVVLLGILMGNAHDISSGGATFQFDAGQVFLATHGDAKATYSQTSKTPAPTTVPTIARTSAQTRVPTFTPTIVQSFAPTSIPTSENTAAPTTVPTAAPTSTLPTSIPTMVQTFAPTSIPTTTAPNSFCLNVTKCTLDIEVVDPWYSGPNWLVFKKEALYEVDCPDVGAGVHVRFGSGDQLSTHGSPHSSSTAATERGIRARIYHYIEANRDAVKLHLTPNIPQDEVRILFRHEATASLKPTTYDSFHLHMGHGHRQSDTHLYFPYSNLIDSWFKKPLVTFDEKEPASALYVQRHCKPSSNRDEYVQQLMSHGLTIDSPGKCLHNKDIPEVSKSWGRTPDSFAGRYKFVFSIENRLCRDYITEKIGNAVRSGAVPIVLSHRSAGVKQTPSYDEIVPSMGDLYPPSRSYIDLADFPNARDAAAYINMVASNETLYRSYLWYRYASAGVQDTVRQSMTREGGIYYPDAPNGNEPSPDVICRAAKKILVVNHTERTYQVDNGCVYPNVVWT